MADLFVAVLSGSIRDAFRGISLGQLETCWGAIAIVTVEIVLLADVVGM